MPPQSLRAAIVPPDGSTFLPKNACTLRQKMLGDAKEVDVDGSYDHIVVQDSRKGEDEDARFSEDFPDVYAFVASIQKQ